jgi:hypothetical protein
MSRGQPNIPENRMLPGGMPDASEEAVRAAMPARQLQEMPRDELKALAEEFGLDSTRFSSPQQLVVAIHERRQMIAAMDREAMLDVIRWGRRPVPLNAGQEQLAQEIVKIKSMRFDGLSLRGLLALARLRNLRVDGNETVATLVKSLKRQEGVFAKLNRKRRGWLGSIVSSIMGEDQAGNDYQFLPPQQGADPGTSGAAGAAGNAGAAGAGSGRSATIKEEIEEQGFFGGIAGRLKRSADSYINQKLDEIEARLDRKLDEIDRRLGEWRDKEIANRIRILKVTLWASVIVGLIALMYAYVKVWIVGR